MRYTTFGDADAEVSVIGLGGHEYFEGGVRGFNADERDRATTPGVNLDGFGDEKRRELLRTALDHGVNFFDVTIDEEKEALGRNFTALDRDEELFVQTRPAGVVYSYGHNNEGLVDYDRLKPAVQRILDLLDRERLEILNVAFEAGALEYHDDFFGSVATNLDRLRDADLIRFASADAPTESAYLEAIDTGAFDAIGVPYHFCNPEPDEQILPAAAAAGMAVITRAVFMKGTLFEMASEAGIEDLDAVARASIRWCLAHDAVTTVIVGADTAAQFERNLAALSEPDLTDDDRAIFDRLEQTTAYEAAVE